MRPDAPSDAPLQCVETPAGTAWYTDEGEGGVLLLLHGMPGSSHDFRWLSPAMSAECRVIRLDLPGFGKSPVGEAGYSLAGRGAFVQAFMETLDLQDVVVAGHSMGGPVAAEVAVKSDRVRALALLASVGPTPHKPLRQNPSVQVAGWLLHLPGLSWALLPRMRRSFAMVGFPDTPDGEILQTLFVLSRFRFDRHRANLAACRVPCLVAWCEDDRVVEGSLGEKLYWASPIGPRICFPTGGHNLQATRSVELAEALAAWMASL